MHRVGNDKRLRLRPRRPPVALRSKHAAVDKRSEQFFEEERISLCASEQLLPNRRWEVRGQHFPKEPLRVAPREEI